MKHCATQLSPVFTDIFNTSRGDLPCPQPVFKPSAIVPDITDPLLDPLQFAYRANRSVDDAVNMALHFILQHLDSQGSYARILFVDFSSAFNTIVPALLKRRALPAECA
ncbi:hypothetical protein QTP70_031480 [Hemibagrus guttatus]|uniref:Reverse transcriptase domain-containing protein n=1 Tax=Hemibagrus guttatus TaxID=175788 RepID=A0AAE0UVP3_9TELE|nr:hypothetical protein QTP70_031480 [Hemibagrus guttatus]